MNSIEIIVVALSGYLLGSIPFAVLIARRMGIDILKTGSGNPGATNVRRVLGKTAGAICLVLDTLKGFLAAGLPMMPVLHFSEPATLGIIGLMAALLGHSFSVFIKFKGGKGVAVTAGGLFALVPLIMSTGMLIWTAVFFTTRYVSLASIALGLSLPVSCLVFGLPRQQTLLCLLLAIIIVVRHRSNILRLLRGTENRFTR